MSMTGPAKIDFLSDVDYVCPMKRNAYSDDEIKREPQFFSADLEYVVDHGGPITKDFVFSLPVNWRSENLIIDSRVHMLMPGWYPCIPGWHLDDVPRNRADGQPDHTSPLNQTRHLTAIVGDESQTIFGIGSFSLMDVPIGAGVVYSIWHKEVELLVSRGVVVEKKLEPGQVMLFNHKTWHRGAAATKSGWRWFIRATIGSSRRFRNEMRTQTQVYLTAPFEGW